MQVALAIKLMVLLAREDKKKIGKPREVRLHKYMHSYVTLIPNGVKVPIPLLSNKWRCLESFGKIFTTLR